MTQLFVRLVLLKVFPNQLKSLLNLTFSQIFWLFHFFLFTLSLADLTTKCNSKEVTFWFSWYVVKM